MFHKALFVIVAGLLCLSPTLLAQEKPDGALAIKVDQAAGFWELTAARLQVVTDDLTAQPAFQILPVPKQPMLTRFTSRQEIALPAVIEAQVRLPAVGSALPPGQNLRGGVVLTLLPASGLEPDGFSLTLSRGRARDDYAYQAAVKGPGAAVARSFTPVYNIADISPLMDQHARLILERRAQQLPPAHHRVFHLRLEVRPDNVRMYVNGRFLEEYRVKVEPGKVVLTLKEDARLLGLTVRPLEATSPAYIPVPLDDHCNAKAPGPIPGLAPEPGRITQLAGVPFIRSAGNSGQDHLDLGPSVFIHRMGIFRIGDSRECVLPPENMDVSRFTLRVPQRTYRRAWVLAASDDQPNTAPVFTLRFYKPKTPWTIDAGGTAPSYQASSAPGQARRIAGAGMALWLIPVELDAAALAVEPMVCFELTKAIAPYRSWPDPAYYNSYPAGLPSSVQVYGLTLEEAPLWARGTGNNNGNLYPHPQAPQWRVLLRNLTAQPLAAEVDVQVSDPYGKVSVHGQKVTLAADGQEHEISVQPPAEVYGLHTVVTTIKAGDFTQSRRGSFLRLPPYTRRAHGSDSPWGLWCWNGTHNTQPSLDENARLLKALGAINNFRLQEDTKPGQPQRDLHQFRQQQDLGAAHYRLVSRSLPAWSTKEPLDQAAYAAFAQEKGLEAAKLLQANPDLQYVNLFAENHISLRLTHGLSPGVMGQPWFELTPEEALRLKAHWLTAKAAQEGVRQHAPGLKVIFGHGAGNFAQPFLRLPDWDNKLFDGFGMDLPQFERMPERQPRATEPNLLFFLHEQMREKGLQGKDIIHLESYFPPTGPMALSEVEQAQSVVRTAVLSLALGTTRFMRTWSLHTSGDGWGGSHYGSAGLIDRAPEFNPKQSAAAFATMTGVLDMAKYDGWVETGSGSAFCVRFKDNNRLVYALWTIRGARPLQLVLEGPAQLTRHDCQGNAFPVEVKDGAASVTLTPDLQWLVVRGGSIKSTTAGAPVYAQAPAANRQLLEDFESADWSYDRNVYERYQTNHWDMPREPGQFASQKRRDEQRQSTVLRVELQKPDLNKAMVGFYGIFSPPKPIALPGKAKALGLWVNGHSAWNRVIYEVVDAGGETWISCGTRDAWNCDDIHSWSSANHDGWRYLRFPLPGNAPGDNYREHDSVWWGSDTDGIVDLPLTLSRIIVEMRPQMIYVDQMRPVADLSLDLDDLTVEYADELSMTAQPVQVQRAAASLLSSGALADLPNPHAQLQKNGVGAAPVIAKVYPPAEFYNGTRLLLEVQPVPGASRYKGYVAAYPDGRGAKALAIDQQSPTKLAKLVKEPNVLFFDQLRPAMPLYFFVTALDAQGRESQPSAIREVLLKDEFPFK